MLFEMAMIFLGLIMGTSIFHLFAQVGLTQERNVKWQTGKLRLCN